MTTFFSSLLIDASHGFLHFLPEFKRPSMAVSHHDQSARQKTAAGHDGITTIMVFHNNGDDNSGNNIIMVLPLLYYIITI